MKKHSISQAFFFAFVLFFSWSDTLAQSDTPTPMSYQGYITQNGIAVTGEYPVTVKLYSDDKGKHLVWKGIYNTKISNGNFNLIFGGSENPLPLSEDMDFAMWVGISLVDGIEMKPLTLLTSVPYARNVPDRSITEKKLSMDLRNKIMAGTGGQYPQVIGSVTWGGDNISGGNAAERRIGSKDNFDWKIIRNDSQVVLDRKSVV